MTPEEIKQVVEGYATYVENKGKEAREKWGVRAVYAAFGAGALLVLEVVVYVVFHGWFV